MSSTTYYVHGPKGLHAQQENDEWKWVLNDGLGSIRSITDSDLAILQGMDFDPFGNLVDMVGSPETAYGYTGEPTDGNGLVYLRNRYYNPQLGVFVSQDPYEGSANNPISLNRYAYVQGNPINQTDPSGMIPVRAINSMMQNNPMGLAQMMNAGGMCFAKQADPCFGYTGQAYIDCSRGLLPTMGPTSTPIPGTMIPSTYHVPCEFSGTFLNIRREPSLFSPIINIVNNPKGIELQVSSFIPGDTQLGGQGWWYVSALGGWVHDSNLQLGSSPCSSAISAMTPTPSPTLPSATGTPSASEFATISKVINCEAARLDISAYGIGHAIYNRMTSGLSEWANYRTALSVIQHTGVDCYSNGSYQNFPTSPASDEAAQWLMGIGTAPSVNALIDLRATHWLGVPVLSNPQNMEGTFAFIVDNPQLYSYSACGANENREARLQRLRDRYVAIDEGEGDLTTIYFNGSPLCEQ